MPAGGVALSHPARFPQPPSADRLSKRSRHVRRASSTARPIHMAVLGSVFLAQSSTALRARLLFAGGGIQKSTLQWASLVDDADKMNEIYVYKFGCLSILQ